MHTQISKILSTNGFNKNGDGKNSTMDVRITPMKNPIRRSIEISIKKVNKNLLNQLILQNFNLILREHQHINYR